MKLYQIEYMLAVRDTGSISRAAETLVVSRPAVSRALKELEAEFGVMLLERTAAGVRLTEAGQIFCEKCTEIRSQLVDLTAEMKRLQEQNAGLHNWRLRLGITFLSRYLFQEMLHEFLVCYPQATIETLEIQSEDTLPLLGEDRTDICIAIDRLPLPDHLAYVTVGEAEFVFCCNRQHRLAKHSSVTVQDIYQEPLIQLEGLAKNNQAVALFAAHGLTPNIRFRTSQVDLIRRMVKAGSCCAIYPREGMQHDPDLVLVPFAHPLKYPIRAIWNDRVRHNEAFRAFLKVAKEFET